MSRTSVLKIGYPAYFSSCNSDYSPKSKKCKQPSRKKKTSKIVPYHAFVFFAMFLILLYFNKTFTFNQRIQRDFSRNQFIRASVNHWDNFEILTPTQNNITSNVTIPHILWFTYKDNILETKTPHYYYTNVLSTISKYREAFLLADPSSRVEVKFLNDEDCLSVIATASEVLPQIKSLTHHFNKERNGAFKSDICRSVALYLFGGYYFDVDMEVIEPFLADNLKTKFTNDNKGVNITFATVRMANGGGFFQSFLACTPRHPIIEDSLIKIVAHYADGGLSLHRGRYVKSTNQRGKFLSNAQKSIIKRNERRVETNFKRRYNTALTRNRRFSLFQRKKKGTSLVGPGALFDAYYDITGVPPKDFEVEMKRSSKRSHIFQASYLLQESDIRAKALKKVRGQLKSPTKRKLCNYVVHDLPTKENRPNAYFYSRINGGSNCPFISRLDELWDFFEMRDVYATCGGGSKGNGVCPIRNQCCSKSGYCHHEFCGKEGTKVKKKQIYWQEGFKHLAKK